MDYLLPSELARLVLGYLEARNCKKSANQLLKELPELAEVAKIRRSGRNIQAKVWDLNLTEALIDYAYSKEIIRKAAEEQPQIMGHLLDRTLLSDQLRCLASAVTSSQTLSSVVTSRRRGKKSTFVELHAAAKPVMGIMDEPMSPPSPSVQSEDSVDLQAQEVDRNAEIVASPAAKTAPQNQSSRTRSLSPNAIDTTSQPELSSGNSRCRNKSPIPESESSQHRDDPQSSSMRKSPKRKDFQAKRRLPTDSSDIRKEYEAHVVDSVMNNHELHQRIASLINDKWTSSHKQLENGEGSSSQENISSVRQYSESMPGPSSASQAPNSQQTDDVTPSVADPNQLASTVTQLLMDDPIYNDIFLEAGIDFSADKSMSPRPPSGPLHTPEHATDHSSQDLESIANTSQCSAMEEQESSTSTPQFQISAGSATECDRRDLMAILKSKTAVQYSGDVTQSVTSVTSVSSPLNVSQNSTSSIPGSQEYGDTPNISSHDVLSNSQSSPLLTSSQPIVSAASSMIGCSNTPSINTNSPLASQHLSNPVIPQGSHNSTQSSYVQIAQVPPVVPQSAGNFHNNSLPQVMPTLSQSSSITSSHNALIPTENTGIIAPQIIPTPQGTNISQALVPTVSPGTSSTLQNPVEAAEQSRPRVLIRSDTIPLLDNTGKYCSRPSLEPQQQRQPVKSMISVVQLPPEGAKGPQPMKIIVPKTMSLKNVDRPMTVTMPNLVTIKVVQKEVTTIPKSCRPRKTRPTKSKAKSHNNNIAANPQLGLQQTNPQLGLQQTNPQLGLQQANPQLGLLQTNQPDASPQSNSEASSFRQNPQALPFPSNSPATSSQSDPHQIFSSHSSPSVILSPLNLPIPSTSSNSYNLLDPCLRSNTASTSYQNICDNPAEVFKNEKISNKKSSSNFSSRNVLDVSDEDLQLPDIENVIGEATQQTSDNVCSESMKDTESTLVGAVEAFSEQSSTRVIEDNPANDNTCKRKSRETKLPSSKYDKNKTVLATRKFDAITESPNRRTTRQSSSSLGSPSANVTSSRQLRSRSSTRVNKGTMSALKATSSTSANKEISSRGSQSTPSYKRGPSHIRTLEFITPKKSPGNTRALPGRSQRSLFRSPSPTKNSNDFPSMPSVDSLSSPPNTTRNNNLSVIMEEGSTALSDTSYNSHSQKKRKKRKLDTTELVEESSLNQVSSAFTTVPIELEEDNAMPLPTASLDELPASEQITDIGAFDLANSDGASNLSSILFHDLATPYKYSELSLEAPTPIHQSIPSTTKKLNGESADLNTPLPTTFPPFSPDAKTPNGKTADRYYPSNPELQIPINVNVDTNQRYLPSIASSSKAHDSDVETDTNKSDSRSPPSPTTMGLLMEKELMKKVRDSSVSITTITSDPAVLSSVSTADRIAFLFGEDSMMSPAKVTPTPDVPASQSSTIELSEECISVSDNDASKNTTDQATTASQVTLMREDGTSATVNSSFRSVTVELPSLGGESSLDDILSTMESDNLSKVSDADKQSGQSKKSKSSRKLKAKKCKEGSRVSDMEASSNPSKSNKNTKSVSSVTEKSSQLNSSVSSNNGDSNRGVSLKSGRKKLKKLSVPSMFDDSCSADSSTNSLSQSFEKLHDVSKTNTSGNSLGNNDESNNTCENTSQDNSRKRKAVPEDDPEGTTSFRAIKKSKCKVVDSTARNIEQNEPEEKVPIITHEKSPIKKLPSQGKVSPRKVSVHDYFPDVSLSESSSGDTRISSSGNVESDRPAVTAAPSFSSHLLASPSPRKSSLRSTANRSPNVGSQSTPVNARAKSLTGTPRQPTSSPLSRTPVTSQSRTPLTSQSHTPLTSQSRTPLTSQSRTPLTSQSRTLLANSPLQSVKKRIVATPVSSASPSSNPAFSHWGIGEEPLPSSSENIWEKWTSVLSSGDGVESSPCGGDGTPNNRSTSRRVRKDHIEGRRESNSGSRSSSSGLAGQQRSRDADAAGATHYTRSSHASSLPGSSKVDKSVTPSGVRRLQRALLGEGSPLNEDVSPLTKSTVLNRSSAVGDDELSDSYHEIDTKLAMLDGSPPKGEDVPDSGNIDLLPEEYPIFECRPIQAPQACKSIPSSPVKDPRCEKDYDTRAKSNSRAEFMLLQWKRTPKKSQSECPDPSAQDIEDGRCESTARVTRSTHKQLASFQHLPNTPEKDMNRICRSIVRGESGAMVALPTSQVNFNSRPTRPSATSPSQRLSTRPSATSPSPRLSTRPSATSPSPRLSTKNSATSPSQQNSSRPRVKSPSQRSYAKTSEISPFKQKCQLPQKSSAMPLDTIPPQRRIQRPRKSSCSPASPNRKADRKQRDTYNKPGNRDRKRRAAVPQNANIQNLRINTSCNGRSNCIETHNVVQEKRKRGSEEDSEYNLAYSEFETILELNLAENSLPTEVEMNVVDLSPEPADQSPEPADQSPEPQPQAALTEVDSSFRGFRQFGCDFSRLAYSNMISPIKSLSGDNGSDTHRFTCTSFEDVLKKNERSQNMQIDQQRDCSNSQNGAPESSIHIDNNIENNPPSAGDGDSASINVGGTNRRNVQAGEIARNIQFVAKACVVGSGAGSRSSSGSPGQLHISESRRGSLQSSPDGRNVLDSSRLSDKSSKSSRVPNAMLTVQENVSTKHSSSEEQLAYRQRDAHSSQSPHTSSRESSFFTSGQQNSNNQSSVAKFATSSALTAAASHVDSNDGHQRSGSASRASNAPPKKTQGVGVVAKTLDFVRKNEEPSKTSDKECNNSTKQSKRKSKSGERAPKPAESNNSTRQAKRKSKSGDRAPASAESKSKRNKTSGRRSRSQGDKDCSADSRASASASASDITDEPVTERQSRSTRKHRRKSGSSSRERSRHLKSGASPRTANRPSLETIGSLSKSQESVRESSQGSSGTLAQSLQQSMNKSDNSMFAATPPTPGKFLFTSPRGSPKPIILSQSSYPRLHESTPRHPPSNPYTSTPMHLEGQPVSHSEGYYITADNSSYLDRPPKTPGTELVAQQPASPDQDVHNEERSPHYVDVDASSTSNNEFLPDINASELSSASPATVPTRRQSSGSSKSSSSAAEVSSGATINRLPSPVPNENTPPAENLGTTSATPNNPGTEEIRQETEAVGPLNESQLDQSANVSVLSAILPPSDTQQQVQQQPPTSALKKKTRAELLQFIEIFHKSKKK